MSVAVAYVEYDRPVVVLGGLVYGAIRPIVLWTAFGAAAAFITLVLVASDQLRRWNERRNAKKPPFCVLCGISAHAPEEQRRLACPRNPDGLGHKFSWGPPPTLPPATAQTVERAILDEAWGETRYRPESTWNETEARAYLRLHRRDEESQGFRVTVFDPSNVSTDSGSFAMSGHGLVALYPGDFRGAPPIISGTYQVRWKAVVDRGGQPVLEEVARDSFEVP